MEFEPVWCDIDLETVERYDPWRLENWDRYASVDWRQACEVMREVVAELASRDALADLPDGLTLAGKQLAARDVEGLYSLWAEPITATAAQITNGGHRITAMREQGVRWAIGMFHPDDIGDSVDPLPAYLPDPRGAGT